MGYLLTQPNGCEVGEFVELAKVRSDRKNTKIEKRWQFGTITYYGFKNFFKDEIVQFADVNSNLKGFEVYIAFKKTIIGTPTYQ